MGQPALNAPSIAGVRLATLRVIADERGAVLHMLRADAGDFTGFGECYFSEVNAGAFKAWKRHRLQGQNLAVPQGRVRFVIFDDRAGSATRGQLNVFELGRPDAYARLHIPPLLWYGFHGLGGAASLVANCADRPHDPEDNELASLEQPSFAGATALLRNGLP